MRLIYILLLLISFTSFAQTEKPTVIYLVRHAEKADDGSKNPPLSDEGNKRALKLAETLKNSGITAVYSTDYKRTKETVTPLVQSLSKEIKVYVPKNEEALKNIVSENTGGVIVICGHSNTTPWTANALAGTNLPDFNDSEYGNILIVTLWADGKKSLTRISY